MKLENNMMLDMSHMCDDVNVNEGDSGGFILDNDLSDLFNLFIYALVLHSRYQLLPKGDWALIK